MVNIRKLVALDIVLHGTRFILAEDAFGVVVLFLLGLSSIRAGPKGIINSNWQTLLGFWLLAVAANYIPPFIYAVLIARGGTVKEEGEPELEHAKRYTLQQVIIFVPLLVVIAAIVQEAGKRRDPQNNHK
jgi:hypothetical protein